MLTETPTVGLNALNASRVPPPPTNGEPADETIYLIGRPPMRGYIRFVRKQGVHPANEHTLAEEWMAANRRIRELEKEEAGFADHPVMTPLTQFGARYEALLGEFLKDPLVQSNFNTVPTDLALVELDRMVVHQKHIDLTFVEDLKKKLGPNPSDEMIFRTCLPFDHPHPPVKWSRMNRNTFVFVSSSNDLRFLDAMQLQPSHILGIAHPGSIVGAVGLAVGFGTNFLNAIYAEGRLILHNGSHRAYALRDLGVTHVPCLVQHVSSRDELEAVIGDEVAEQADRFLKDPRPSVLKDYFEPALRKVVPVHRRVRQVTVKFEIEEGYIPAL